MTFDLRAACEAGWRFALGAVAALVLVLLAIAAAGPVRGEGCAADVVRGARS